MIVRRKYFHKKYGTLVGAVLVVGEKVIGFQVVMQKETLMALKYLTPMTLTTVFVTGEKTIRMDMKMFTEVRICERQRVHIRGDPLQEQQGDTMTSVFVAVDQVTGYQIVMRQ